MKYDACREIVSRYVNTIKCYDEMLDLGVRMGDNISGIMSTYDNKDIMFTCSVDKKEITRNQFIKNLQKDSWRWIFKKMNLDKFLTQDVYSKLNAKIEEYSSLKFTMKNIYTLVDMLIQTQGQRMNESLKQSFDMITKHHKKNRHNVEGWKTNDSYMVGKKFILGYVCDFGFR